MVTNVKLELTDSVRAHIALVMTGKKGLATRAQVNAYVTHLIKNDLNPAAAKSFVTVICPKCQKPIGVQVPKK